RQNTQQLLDRGLRRQHSIHRTDRRDRAAALHDTLADLFTNFHDRPAAAGGAAFLGSETAAFRRTPPPWPSPTTRGARDLGAAARAVPDLHTSTVRNNAGRNYAKHAPGSKRCDGQKD